jgi:hypothetical protein
MTRPRTHRGEEGYILASALAALFAMSIVAAALVAASVNELRRVAAAERTAADEAAAEAAIALAADELLRDPRERRLSFDHGAAEVVVNGRAVAVEVGFESDKVDLNYASVDDIDAALVAHDVPESDRLAIRRALDRRGSGGFKLTDDALAGVEAPECARQALTVFGGRRGWTEADAGATMTVGVPAPGARIWVSAQVGEGAAARAREAVLLITGDPREPVRVMDWRLVRGSREEACHGERT